MRLFLVARDKTKLDQVAAELSGRYKVEVTVHAADLSSTKALEKAAQAALATLDTIDALVNCAGAAKRGDFFQLYSATIGQGFFFEIVERRNGYSGYGAPNAPFRIAAQKRAERLATLSI